MSIESLPEAWDALASAIRRMLDATPGKMTEAAARLEDDARGVDALVRRIAMRGDEPPFTEEGHLADQIRRDSPAFEPGESRIHNWKTYVGEQVATMWPRLPLATRFAIATDAQAQADREEWE